MSNDIKCERCGRFISYQDLEDGKAKSIHTPDSYYTLEGVEFICSKCRDVEEMTFENYCNNHCIYKHQDKRNEEPCINCPAQAWADRMEGEG